MKSKRHVADILFVIALIGIFAVTSVILIVLGINVYRKAVHQGEENYQNRTALLYISEKIHQQDQEGAIILGAVADSDALILHTDVNSQHYETWIFANGGHLREAQVKGGTQVQPTDGQKILAVKKLQIIPVSSQLYTIKITQTDGQVRQINIHTNSAQGGIQP